MHTIRQPTVRLALFKPVASEAQSSTRLLFPPTLFSPISLTPNFSLLWSDYCHVYPPCLHLPPLSLCFFAGARGFHQLLGNNVARVSQLQGELLTADSREKPSVMSPNCDVDTCGMCEHPCNSRSTGAAFALFASLCLQWSSPD